MVETGKYRHFKGGEYMVLHTATHSESLEEMVVYTPLYEYGKIWVRPAAMWDELVEYNGQTVKRFTLVE